MKNQNEKTVATFSDGTTTHFGDSRYEDYTMHRDEQRKQRYIARHKHDKLDDPRSAGALSMYILWNKPTLTVSVQDFKRRFNV